jgi:hypothetical protein
MIARFIKSPWMSAATGLVLILTAGIEMMDDVGFPHPFGIGLHHGVLVAGILQLLKGLFEGLEGFNRISEASEEQ